MLRACAHRAALVISLKCLASATVDIGAVLAFAATAAVSEFPAAITTTVDVS